jgi:hypothetical protein
MKIVKETPAFLRYFNSRFKFLTKPVFWGSLGGLLIAGFAVYQYWQHPDWLQTNSESVEDSTSNEQKKLPNVSSEELATGADIDNLDLLIKEIDQNRTLSAIAESRKNDKSSELKREESAFSDLQKQQKAKLSNPNRSSSSDSNPYSVGIDTGNKKIMELLKPPSFSSYQSSTSTSNQNTNLKGTAQSKNEIIPNPVGNIYLSNRNKQPSATTPGIQVAPASEVATPGIASNTNPSNPSNPAYNGVNPNQSAVSTTNGQNTQNSQGDTQINSTIPPVNTTVPNINQFVPASSLIQSQQTPPTPLTNSVNSSSTTGFNSINLYPTNNYSNNTLNGINSNSVNPINNNPSATSPNLTGTSTGTSTGTTTETLTQPTQNTVIPGLTTRGNITREGLTTTGNSNDPSSLQNNYRSYKLGSPSNYNSSTPSGYQLQPQNYPQNNANGNGASGLNNGTINRSSNSYSQPTNSPPVTNLGTPSLQPSGTLSTGEVGR